MNLPSRYDPIIPFHIDQIEELRVLITNAIHDLRSVRVCIPTGSWPELEARAIEARLAHVRHILEANMQAHDECFAPDPHHDREPAPAGCDTIHPDRPF